MSVIKRSSLTTLLCIAAICSVSGHAIATSISIRVSAFIDGKDQLVIHGQTLEWRHLTSAAPGRFVGADVPTIIGTTLNGQLQMEGVEWFPIWPFPVPDEIRFPANSSRFQQLTPRIPNTELDVRVDAVPIDQCEGAPISQFPCEPDLTGEVSVFQHPSAENGYTTIVEFDDDEPRGARMYLVDILFAGGGVSPPLKGDYNGNGRVEQGDIDLVLLNWAADAFVSPANWIADLPTGFIDQDELDGVLLNWGSTSAAPIFSQAAVPEPSTIVSALFCIGTICLVRSSGTRPLLCLSCVVVCNATSMAAEFIPLGFLPGQADSRANGISQDGRHVVGNSGSTAFRWNSEDGMIALGDFIADDVSADGTVVVGGDGIANAYRWKNGTLSVIGDLTAIGRTGDSPGGTRMSSAHGVSADGMIIVGNTPAIDGQADSFRLIGSRIEPVGDLPGGVHDSGARAVSADGSVVVGRGNTDDGNEAYRWENGVFESLGDLPGGAFESRVWTVSSDGNVIVGQSESEAGLEAFRWTRQTGMVGLGHLPEGAKDSRARGVSGDGNIVVGIANRGTPWESEAFLWDQWNGIRNLQAVFESKYGLSEALAGWHLFRAFGINDEGSVIIGTGVNPAGLAEAWVAIVPELIEDLFPVGDYNGNGHVEQRDLDLVLLHWGVNVATPPVGWDRNLPNGAINQDELDAVLLNWGNTAALATASVPEPTALLLLVTGLVSTQFVIRHNQ